MTESRTKVLMPIAVIIAGGLIGLGLFLGLRDRDGSRSADESREQRRTSEPADKPERDPKAVAKIAAQIRASIDKLRPAIEQACYRPAVRDMAPPAPTWRATFTFQFDESGAQLGRGVAEHRVDRPIAIANCVGKMLPKFDVGAAGANLTGVTVDVEFP